MGTQNTMTIEIIYLSFYLISDTEKTPLDRTTFPV